MSNDPASTPDAPGFGRRAFAPLLLAALLPAGGSAQPAPAPIGAAVGALGDALLRGAALLPRPAGHVFSPFNLHATLGLLALGARGRTATEFAALLGARGGVDRLAALLARGRAAVADAEPGITQGYAAWASRRRRFEDDWRDLARQALAPRVGRLDFAAPGAVPTLNAWASRATRGEIPVIVDRLPAEAELVLAGAIHFAGTWQTPFPAADTAPAPFRRLDGTAADVQMMRATMTVGYGAAGLGHAVRLPYRGGRLALWIAAAKRPEDSGAFLSSLAEGGTTTWLRALAMRQSRTQVSMPRLSLSAGGETLPLLRQAGFGRVLDGDFSGILGRPIRPSEILHRARIRIDEKGTVAAAATAVVATRSLQEVEEFTADRPCVFVLGLAEPWLPLFMGYVGDATALA